ncbi:MAG: hypothetical protein ACI4KC_03615 [Gemmiger sp.]
MMNNKYRHPTDMQKAASPPPGGSCSSDSNCAGTVLQLLGISSKPYPCRIGEFYFCTVPTDKSLTFNLRFSDNRTIRLWRFIGTAPRSAAGYRWEYRNPNVPLAVIGLEVTTDGDICFFAEQELEAYGTASQARISRMVSGYITVITSFSGKVFST